MADGPFDPPFVADERSSMRAWLRYQRESMIAKLDGLTEEQARWTPAPTANSLLGLVNHLAFVEHWWFHECFAGKPMELPDVYAGGDRDADFKPPADQTIAFTVDRYRTECARSDAIEHAAESLDDMAAHEKRKPSLRWIMVHMIEETARHAGHADITRELIDGSTGML